MKKTRILAIITMIMCVLPVLAQEEAEGALPLWLEAPLWILGIIFIPVVLIVFFVGMYKKVFRTIWYVISLQGLRRRKLREQLAEGLEYFREPPVGGDLKVANVVMNSLSSAWLADYKGLFGALILRLADKEAITMEVKSNVYGAEPHVVLSVNEWPDNVKVTEETQIDKDFHDLLYNAAGSDKVLQPREIQQYLRNSGSVFRVIEKKEDDYDPTGPAVIERVRTDSDDFLTRLTKLTPKQQESAKDTKTAQQLLAFKKFLLDFSLIKERDMNEMKLWKEYLVYAMLFGIADKVCENFEKVYPDYFKGNALASMRLNIVGNNALVTYVDAVDKGAKDLQKEEEKKKKS